MNLFKEYKEGAKSTIASWNLKRKLAWLTAIILLGLLTYVLVVLFYPYSNGTRTGILRKLSHKGYVFKTWEGELQMSVFVTQPPQEGGSVPVNGNIWFFSVERGNDAVIKQLQDAEASGKRVTLHYIEHLRQFDWRGDTKYFVDKVTIHSD